ncbi:trehalose-phosphatase [Roseomonas hellenica]|uniref:Trehalose 6-phosphate phosphatase n=1 Tax=Plastoroseomonas hellenica TaxID=2687306 RepID=A0ABS5F317_9PROT|nr:trehalose-phosphatase [Plastoroseomonas hellenica]MBR0666911.1 trehalose-phosphatase [Plastoroseomonas hellenica]
MDARNLPTPRDVLSRGALLLDFDGTLVDIAAAPSLITVPTGLQTSLATLSRRLAGAMALVSGRSVAEIDGFLAPLVLPVAGEHGAAIRFPPDRTIRRPVLPMLPDAWRRAAESWASATPGVLVEEKHSGLVLHYRRAPAAAEPLRAALAGLIGDSRSFEIMEASAAWELRPSGIDKGQAVRAVMAEPDFTGRWPIFVGDDVTDEDGMAAARAMGGIGLRVQDVFGDAAGVRAWLASLAAAEGK